MDFEPKDDITKGVYFNGPIKYFRKQLPYLQ
jgi:hypothetical protein